MEEVSIGDITASSLRKKLPDQARSFQLTPILHTHMVLSNRPNKTTKRNFRST